MVVNNLWFLLQEMGLVDPHRITYGWQKAAVYKGKLLYHSKVQTRFNIVVALL